MSKAKFVAADTWSSNPNLTAWNNAVGAKTAVALTVAAMITLASADASQIAQYTGSNYDGATSCNTFTFTSISDPHIYSNFGSGVTEKTQYSGDLDNLNTVYNTAGGQTTLSTKTTGVVIADGTTDFYNTSSSMKHSGWSLNTTINAAGQQTISIKQGSTTTVIAPGSGNGQKFTLKDGTVVLIKDANDVVVTQALNAGGQVTTEYTSVANGSEPYLNIIQSANGTAIVSGAAGVYGTGQDVPIMSYGCDGSTPTTGEFLGGAVTPAPAAPPVTQPIAPPAPPVPIPAPPAPSTPAPADPQPPSDPSTNTAPDGATTNVQENS